MDDRHQEAAMLLPWYATGAIGAEDRTLVERHLEGCETCRADLAAERRLAGAVAETGAATDTGWEEMAARLAAREALARPASRPVPAPRSRTRAWSRADALLTPRRLKWVAAAQFAGLLALGAVALRPDGAGEYRTLSGDATQRAGNVIAMFRPDIREADLRRSLDAAGARLVDGPTSAGAWVLEVPGGAEGPRLDALRRDPRVTMAEPIEQAPAE